MRSYVHMEEYGVYCLDIHSAIFKIAIFQLKYKYIYAYMCTYIVNSHMLMWAYICICVCVYIYIHMYIYECVYIYVYICTNTKNHWHAQVCKYARIKIVYHLDIHCDIFNISYVCDLPLSFCTFAYTHTHTHTHTHTNTHTHTHTRTRVHTYTQEIVPSIFIVAVRFATYTCTNCLVSSFTVSDFWLSLYKKKKKSWGFCAHLRSVIYLWETHTQTGTSFFICWLEISVWRWSLSAAPHLFCVGRVAAA